MLPFQRERAFADLEGTGRRKMAPLVFLAAGSALAGAVAAAAATYLGMRAVMGADPITSLLSESGSLPRPWTPGKLRFTESRAEDVLGELKPEEVRSVAEWFITKVGASGVRTSAADCVWLAGSSAVELLHPPKAAAVAFLDGTGPLPARFARVTTVGPDGVQEWRVGPIAGGKPAADATHHLLTSPGDVPYAKRPTEPNADIRVAEPLLNRTILAVGAPLLVRAFGNIFPQLAGFTGKGGFVNPFARNDALAPKGERYDLVKMLWVPPPPSRLEAMWLHPVPFSLKLNTTAQDPAAWNLLEVTFCGQNFGTGEDLRAAYERGEVRVCPFSNDTGKWDVPQRTTPPSPDGLRPKEEKKGVEWGPWTFTITQRPSTGLAIMDVRFRGERVLYELSLQDAQAAYSGERKDQFFYSDAAFSLAQLGTSLEPGVDCPVGARYLSSTIWYSLVPGGGAETDPRDAREFWPVCVFEWAEDHTLWRHMQNSAPQEVTGYTRYTAVVRSVTTVGNYDYITDTKFREDGEIEVHTKFAGFIESRYYNPAVNPTEVAFSTILRPDLAGPVHSHLVSWKADIDVAGVRANALRVLRVKTKSVAGNAGEPALTSKFIEPEVVEKEGVGLSTFVADPRMPGMWTLVDQKATSAAGNPRGYAIALSSFATTQVLEDDHPFVRAMPFTKYHLAVTKYHDSEYRVNSPYEQYDGQESVRGQNLDTFLADGESLVDEDLVAWICVGREHIVRQEDLPLVSNFGGGFSLMPWNFFEQNVGASPPW